MTGNSLSMSNVRWVKSVTTLSNGRWHLASLRTLNLGSMMVWMEKLLASQFWYFLVRRSEKNNPLDPVLLCVFIGPSRCFLGSALRQKPSPGMVRRLDDGVFVWRFSEFFLRGKDLGRCLWSSCLSRMSHSGPWWKMLRRCEVGTAYRNSSTSRCSSLERCLKCLSISLDFFVLHL